MTEIGQLEVIENDKISDIILKKRNNPGQKQWQASAELGEGSFVEFYDWDSLY